MSEDRLQELRDKGFEIREWQEVLAAVAPDQLDAWLDHAMASKRTSSIDPKLRELIFVAIDSLSRWPHTDRHVAAALDAGAEVAEIVGVLETVAYLKGPHAWVTGLEALGKVLAERGELPA